MEEAKENVLSGPFFLLKIQIKIGPIYASVTVMYLRLWDVWHKVAKPHFLMAAAAPSWGEGLHCIPPQRSRTETRQLIRRCSVLSEMGLSLPVGFSSLTSCQPDQPGAQPSSNPGQAEHVLHWAHLTQRPDNVLRCLLQMAAECIC